MCLMNLTCFICLIQTTSQDPGFGEEWPCRSATLQVFRVSVKISGQTGNVFAKRHNGFPVCHIMHPALLSVIAYREQNPAFVLLIQSFRSKTTLELHLQLLYGNRWTGRDCLILCSCTLFEWSSATKRVFRAKYN